jgi:hypothetical protein
MSLSKCSFSSFIFQEASKEALKTDKKSQVWWHMNNPSTQEGKAGGLRV